MTIIEIRSDSSPAGIQKRLMKRNNKDDLARAIRQIRDHVYRDGNAEDKLAEIEKIIDARIWA